MLEELRFTQLYILCILHWPVLMRCVQVGYYACTEVPSYWHPATPSHCPTHATNILLLESFERETEKDFVACFIDEQYDSAKVSLSLFVPAAMLKQESQVNCG